MVDTVVEGESGQLPMPGMPAGAYTETVVSRREVVPGRQVLYTGRLSGGPRYGAIGVVRQAQAKRALVDMGMYGRWYIPYYFLSLPAGGA